MTWQPSPRAEDEWNRRLFESVRPIDWKNPSPAKCYDLVALGGGVAGLVAAVVSAGLEHGSRSSSATAWAAIA